MIKFIFEDDKNSSISCLLQRCCNKDNFEFSFGNDSLLKVCLFLV